MNQQNIEQWLAIRTAPQMTRNRFHALMQRYRTPADVFGAPAQELATVRGFDQYLATAVLNNMHAPGPAQHLEKMYRLGISLVTRDSPDFPFSLAHSQLAPPLLFCKGSLAPEDKYAIAMVGSRHATTYGRSVARELAGGLCGFGLTIVSGFARGVDGEAHHAAVKAGGRTIAVLGNGLDVCYPSEHRSLVEQVSENGALISEYPLGTPPDRFNFPERNHVIAALSLGTIIVEAAERSGSLITARLAVEENRFIFAVPGDITRNNSRGANSLIQQGARMVQRPLDVLIEMKDLLRGYLDVDQIEAEQIAQDNLSSNAVSAPAAEKRASRKPPAPTTTSALPDFDENSATLPGTPPDNAVSPRVVPAPASTRDWVDDLVGLEPGQLELVAANLQTDDRQTENPLTLAPPPEPVAPVAAAAALSQPDATAAESAPPEAIIAAPQIPPAHRIPTRSARPVLSQDEELIVSLLRHEAMVFDDLADRAFGHGIDVPRLTSLLMKLELRRVIRQLPGRYYVLFAG